MKKLGFIVILTFLCIRCNSVEQNIPPLEIRVVSMQKVSGKSVSRIEHKINFELINNSKDNILYWSMSCSWEENWLCDPNCFQLTNRACDGNVPEINLIRSGETKKLKSWVFVADPLQAHTVSKFKLGFIYIKANEVKSVFNFKDVLAAKASAKQDIFWSKEIDLKELEKE